MASVAPSRIETRLNLPSPKVENASEDTRTSSLNIARSEDQAKASLAPIPTADPTSEQNQAATLHLLQPDIDPNGQPQQAVETGSSASELSLPLTDTRDSLNTEHESPAPAQGAAASVDTAAFDDLATGEPDVIETSGSWIEEQVKPGDSLAKIFSRLDLSPVLLHRIVNSSKEAKGLSHIKPGEILRVHIDDEGQLLELIHQRSPVRSLRIVPDGDSFKARKIERDLDKRVTQASGIISSSLYESAKRAGLTDTLIMELANIFGWDIDFALEIRSGDRFSLIYEEEYLDGAKYGNGPILAAEFVNKGKVFRAVRYQDQKGDSSYFSPDGKSMRKAFLRAPVDFRRISSRFNRSRWHPVLGKKRPHRGVDYAAAIGTPIKAAGDGKVVFRGRKGGYGNTVIIKHGSQYTTLYGHMSKFRRKVKNGSRVRQGQIIGYVGKTGLATGPHLHYEFRVNGTHRNPLTVKLPAAAPINKKYRADFQTKSAPLLAQLDLISETMVANAE
jgi:murein DD-endopeptidase MepM/ murein hydrolase activator NlpD